MSDQPNCWNCGATLQDLPRPVSRHEYCNAGGNGCGEPVHCCRMCVSFDPDRAEQCREDRAEPPTDKTCANFCDFFTLRAGSGGAERQDDREAAARAKLDALFGGDPQDG